MVAARSSPVLKNTVIGYKPAARNLNPSERNRSIVRSADVLNLLRPPEQKEPSAAFAPLDSTADSAS